MNHFLPFSLPDITELEINEVNETLRSGWLTTGKKVSAFEEQFAKRVGSRHAVAVNSCTAALHLALEAIGVGASHEVIVPTMTFSAMLKVFLVSGVSDDRPRPAALALEGASMPSRPGALEATCWASGRVPMVTFTCIGLP